MIASVSSDNPLARFKLALFQADIAAGLFRARKKPETKWGSRGRNGSLRLMILFASHAAFS
jgi:hypothetical protein